jgi:hypothetical protein
MKNLFLLLLAILTVVFLILGYMYWQDRTDISTKKIDDSPINVKQSVQEEKKMDTETDTASTFEKRTRYWPEIARNQFLQAVESSVTYKIAIVGSPALGTDSNGWSVQLQNEISDAYGDHIDVKLFESDTTSIEFINSPMAEDVTNYQPDLVLFEPFTLNDNTVGVAPEDTAYSVNAFLTDLQAANEGVTLILQPGHPLYEAVYYPQQVDKLKAFAEENGLTYLDHWTEWPESDNEALQEYLTESQDVPSEKGHKLWADYLMDYFISE